MTTTEQNKARRRINQVLGWLFIMNNECESVVEWRIKVYYLILYAAGLISEATIQREVLSEIAL